MKAEFTSLSSNLGSNSLPLGMDNHCIFPEWQLWQETIFAELYQKNYNRYREHTNTVKYKKNFQLQTLNFPYSHNYYVFSLHSSFCGLAALLNWLRHAFFSHFAITTAEMNDPLLNCAHIHCLISKPWISGFNLFFSSLNELQYYLSFSLVYISSIDVILLTFKTKQ